jgi:hypothetical protein
MLSDFDRPRIALWAQQVVVNLPSISMKPSIWLLCLTYFWHTVYWWFTNHDLLCSILNIYICMYSPNFHHHIFCDVFFLRPWFSHDFGVSLLRLGCPARPLSEARITSVFFPWGVLCILCPYVYIYRQKHSDVIIIYIYYLVGGLEQFLFSHILGISTHPNWRTPSFFGGVGIPPTSYPLVI